MPFGRVRPGGRYVSYPNDGDRHLPAPRDLQPPPAALVERWPEPKLVTPWVWDQRPRRATVFPHLALRGFFLPAHAAGQADVTRKNNLLRANRKAKIHPGDKEARDAGCNRFCWSSWITTRR